MSRYYVRRRGGRKQKPPEWEKSVPTQPAKKLQTVAAVESLYISSLAFDTCSAGAGQLDRQD